MAATQTKSIRRGQLVLSAQATASFSAPLFRISTPLPSSKTISARLQGPTAIWVCGWTSNAREMSRWAASQFPDPQTRSSSFGIMGTATVKPCAQTTITLTAALNSTRPQRKQSRFTGISRSICLVSRPPGRRPGSRPELMQRPCPPGGFRFRLEATPGALESTDFDPSCSAIRQQAKHRRRRCYRTKDSSGASQIVLARGGPVDWASAVHPRGSFDQGACAAALYQSAGSSNEFRLWHDGCWVDPKGG